MESKKQNRSNSKSRLTQGLLAATVAALVVMPVPSAGAADGPVAAKSAASLSKKVKRLKLMLAEQDRRLRALESRLTGNGTTTTTNTTGAPSGPAGGDLTGTYPNPTIGPNTITGADVANHSLTGDDLANNTLTGAFIFDNSLTGADVMDQTLGRFDLASESVASSALATQHTVIGERVTVSNDNQATASVTCPGAEQLITGGFGWSASVDGLYVIGSAPNYDRPNKTWEVTGRNHSGSAVDLYPWATCLPE